MDYQRRSEVIAFNENINPPDYHYETSLTTDRWENIIQDLMDQYWNYLAKYTDMTEDNMAKRVAELELCLMELDDEELLFLENEGIFANKEIYDKFA